MSDNTADRKLRRLEDTTQTREVEIALEARRAVEQRLQRGEQQLEASKAQGEQAKDREWEYLEKRVDLEKQLEQLDDSSLQISEEERQRRREEVKRQIEQLKDEYAPEPSGDARPAVPSLNRTSEFSGAETPTAPRPSEGLQPRAFGERAMAERAESGPEKKDRELYLAEKRLKG